MKQENPAKNKNIDLKNLILKAKKIASKIRRHAPFIAVMAILLTYIFVVWQISQLATAEPTDDASAAAVTDIPKVDPKAIQQIQSLEQSNTQIRTQFNQARDNPFQE